MSTIKLSNPTGAHMEDVVEYTYYLWTQQASILNYLSTLGQMCSIIFQALSAAGTSYSISLSAWGFKSTQISKFASFPVSMTTHTGVSINIANV